MDLSYHTHQHIKRATHFGFVPQHASSSGRCHRPRPEFFFLQLSYAMVIAS